MTAGVLRIIVSASPHRIVMIARVFGIDRHERNLAQIGAPTWVDGFRGGGFIQRIAGEFRRNAVRMNGDKAHGPGRIHAAQPLHHACARQTGSAAR